MKSTFLLLPLLIGLLFENQVLALTLQDEMSAYNKNDYPQAIAIGHQLAKENPSEPDCHYYLANAYSRVGQIEEAMKEYSICLNLTDNPQLRNYCDQALVFFTSNRSANHPSASAAANVRHARHHNSEITYIPTNNIQPTDDIQSTGKAKLAEIKDSSKQAIESIPKFYYNSSSGRLEQNPEYQSSVEEIRRKQQSDTQTVRLMMQNGKQKPNSLSPNNSPKTAQYNTIPGYMKPMPYRKPSYIDSLFNASPLPPPPFPTSAKKGAEKALNQQIN